MSDFDDFDGVIGRLRSTATASELAGETKIVSLMSHAHRTAKENTMFTSRRARVATLLAAGILGFGGVAAAGAGGPLSRTTSDSGGTPMAEGSTTTTEREEVTTTTEEATTTTTENATTADANEESATPEAAVPADATPLADDTNTKFDERYCEPGNHGKTVSKAAHGGLFNGAAVDVVDAAHSSCGKMADSAATPDIPESADTPDSPDSEAPEVEVDDTEADEQNDAQQHDKPVSPADSAKGSARGEGKGESKDTGESDN